MPRKIDVYLEAGKSRVFAGALEWPGWSRSGRDPDAALAALLAYGPRYAAAMKGAAAGFEPPTDGSAFRIVERLEGDATTDFGAPGIAPEADGKPVDARRLKRLQGLLEASWLAFDRAAEAAAGATLAKGPRGGGRELDAIMAHLMEAEVAYLSRLGGRFPKQAGETLARRTRRLRETFLETLASRARGEPPAPSRSTKPPWTPRYAVRRSAWHALDHAWEIEDRAGPKRSGKAKRASG